MSTLKILNDMEKTPYAGELNYIFHTGINHQYESFFRFFLFCYLIPPLFVSAWNFCFVLFTA